MSLLPEEARREKIEAALAAHDPGQHERVRVPYKDDAELCPVVQVLLQVAALNPRSHRIRSELESDPQAEQIRADPFSDDSQDRIGTILRDTEGFPRLKESLDEEGQRDHGVLTRAGVLVNANTRAVALADLGKSHIKVAVLPADAGEREIADLEIRLQMQRDLKQEYSFTNELLFIEDLLTSYHRSNEEVAKILRRSEREIEQSVRILALIREIQRRSDRQIQLTFFDDKAQALAELDRDYEALYPRDHSGAQRLRDNRILGLLVNAGYREMREANEDFVEDYLISAIEDKPELAPIKALLFGGPVETNGKTPEGVNELMGGEEDDGSEGSPTAGPLVDLLATKHGEEHVTLPGPDGPQEVECEQLLGALNEAVRDAADEAKADRKREKGLEGPIARIRDARKALRKARTEYREVVGADEFDHGAFEYEARKLQNDVDAIKSEIEKQRR